MDSEGFTIVHRLLLLLFDERIDFSLQLLDTCSENLFATFTFHFLFFEFALPLSVVTAIEIHCHRNEKNEAGRSFTLLDS